MERTYNPCDDCEYSVSKQNQESGMCKICEFKKAQTASSYMGIAQSKFKAELDAYKTAEEQGLLLRLPCKVGDVLYQAGEGYYQIGFDITEYIVTTFTISRQKMQICVKNGDLGFVVNADSIGKRFFLTREEAESALAEKGGAE